MSNFLQQFCVLSFLCTLFPFSLLNLFLFVFSCTSFLASCLPPQLKTWPPPASSCLQRFFFLYVFIILLLSIAHFFVFRQYISPLSYRPFFYFSIHISFNIRLILRFHLLSFSIFFSRLRYNLILNFVLILSTIIIPHSTFYTSWLRY